jgi:hypothetical protein
MTNFFYIFSSSSLTIHLFDTLRSELLTAWAVSWLGFPQRRLKFGPRSGHVGVVVDKLAMGQVFSEFFGFSWQFSFHQLLYTDRSLFGAGTIGSLVADVPSCLTNKKTDSVAK